jgi:hypothetical protein
MRKLSKRLVLLTAVLLLGSLAVTQVVPADARGWTIVGARPDGACFYYEVASSKDTLELVLLDVVAAVQTDVVPVVPGEVISAYRFVTPGWYWLVTDWAGNEAQMGVELNGDAGVYAAGTGMVRLVDGEEALRGCFGTIADGRLNSGDLAAPVIVYPDGDGGVKFYMLDENGDGQMVLHVTAEQIAAIASPPAANTLIAEGAGIAFYRLATGEFQVNMGEYVVIFDALDAGAGFYHP